MLGVGGTAQATKAVSNNLDLGIEAFIMKPWEKNLTWGAQAFMNWRW
jgi:hypothetical protein